MGGVTEALTKRFQAPRLPVLFALDSHFWVSPKHKRQVTSGNLKHTAKKDAGNLKVPVVADINVEDNETGIAPNSSMEVHKENPSSADTDYHFVPNPRGQSIDC